MNPFEYRSREWYRKRCLELFFFCSCVLGKAWLDKFQDLGYIHEKLCAFLQSPSTKKLISQFRGSYKTTIILGFVIWLFCWNLVRGKPISICYNTATKENAEAFMREFQETLKECALLNDIFPELPVDWKSQCGKWSKWVVIYKWVKFQVASLDTKQVSRHHTVIINDDLVDDDNAYSEKERETVKRKWKYQKSIITKYKKREVGLEVDVGTPYDSRDLMYFMINKLDTYEKFLVPYAVRTDGKPVDPFLKDGILTFPEMFMWEDFQEKFSEQGKSIFSTQYQLFTVEESDKLCDEEWLRYYKFLPENRIRVMVVDPAGTEDTDNPATGITICDTDQTGTIYVVFAGQFWVTPMQLIKKMEWLKEEFDPDEIYIEKEKYSITIADTVEHLAPSLNFDFVSHKDIPKPARIAKLKQYLETGRILLRQGMKELENQLLEYPSGAKDILDSLAYQVRVMTIPNKKIMPDREIKVEDAFEEEIARIEAFNDRLGGNHDAWF